MKRRFTFHTGPCIGAAVLLLALCGSLSADALTEGQAAFADRNYPEALRLLLPLAEEGVPSAQLRVGYMHFYGLGVSQDYGIAHRWVLAAARQGSSMAQHLLSRMYCYGWGVPQDLGEAFKWCRKAAEQGLADAMASTGTHYVEGAGVATSPDLAVDWFFKAGMLYLEKEQRDKALEMVELIRSVNRDHYLSYRLLDEIYGE